MELKVYRVVWKDGNVTKINKFMNQYSLEASSKKFDDLKMLEQYYQGEIDTMVRVE